MIDLAAVHVVSGSFSLSDVAFHVPRGAYAILMGRTGSGKTTLLEAICGLRRVLSGTIALEGRDVTRLRPGERGIGFVPQDGALFESLSVRQHIEFALEVRRWAADARRRRVAELAELLGIAPLLERGVPGLSGGERQRVALARALSFRPSILCLDEPLSALDETTRDGMIELLGRLPKAGGVTVLHVTHSSTEAERLGDLRLRLADGKVVVESPPAAVEP